MVLSCSRKIRALVAAAVVVGFGSMASADSFTFATYTWDQDNTPNVLGLLGSGATLGGAGFSSGNATTITGSVGFIAVSGNAGSGFVGAPGFNPNLSLGKQANAQHGLTQSGGGSSVFSSAVNLPAGNNGSTTRHGLAFSWNNGKTVVNGAGADFVLYESGSNSTSPEGQMVRARIAATGLFTDWFYFAANTFQNYTQTPTPTNEGAFATAYDLTAMGVLPGVAVDLIQMANLIASDRIVGALTHTSGLNTYGQGQVVFGSALTLKPDPGALASFRNNGYGSGDLDPDPLWVGILNASTPGVVPLPAAAWMGLSLLGTAAAAKGYRRIRHAR